MRNDEDFLSGKTRNGTRWSPASLAVLALLAVLQYDSSKAVRSATAQQMLTNLEGSVSEYAPGIGDTNSLRCAGICSFTKARPGKLLCRNMLTLSERWRRGAVHPSLVSTIYIWQPEANHSSNLYRLDSDAGKFVHADWPSDLAPIRLQIQQMSRSF